MSAVDRELGINTRKLLDSFMKISEEVINEAAGNKMIDLKEIEKFLSDKDLSYMMSDNDGIEKKDIKVELFFVPTKTVQVPEENNLEFTFSISNKNGESTKDMSLRAMSDGLSSESLERAMRWSKVIHGKDKMSAEYVTSLCDPFQIYNIYQEQALRIIRKYMSNVYYMFTGPNLYKVCNTSFPTLGVRWDNLRRKYQYIYNPDFILTLAIEEWCLRRDRYRSLVDCYIYQLAFLITHEMLHIIHHNATSSNISSVGKLVDVGNFDVNNRVQDSFINCKIGRRFLGVEGIYEKDGLAPFPHNCVGSRLLLRSKHNEGFKKFKDVKEVVNKVAEVTASVLRVQFNPSTTIIYENKDLSGYEGADVVINIHINPALSLVRSNGSGSFQVLVNEMLKCVVSGKVYPGNEKYTDEEKSADLNILPVGTLIKVKNTSSICHVQSYDEASGLYTLTKAKELGIKKVDVQGTTLSVMEYGVSNDVYGTKLRYQIRPYNPMDDAYVEEDTDKKNEISPEDMAQAALQSIQGQMPDMGGSQGKQVQPKNLKVGQIVYIKSLGKFGKITLSNNGEFRLEEMTELPAKIIDTKEINV